MHYSLEANTNHLAACRTWERVVTTIVAKAKAAKEAREKARERAAGRAIPVRETTGGTASDAVMRTVRTPPAIRELLLWLIPSSSLSAGYHLNDYVLDNATMLEYYKARLTPRK
jgi:hypothetical protein